MKIFVSAAEISSDIHAEKILKALSHQLMKKGESIEWMGVGGPRVSSLPGFRCLEPAENLRSMGFVVVLGKISYFKRLIDRVSAEISRFNPDLILTFDYPDFHFRLMKKVVNLGLAPNALRVCGIPPKVWVWRSGRVEKIRSYYHGVWVIFPFEKDFYESRSIPVIFEGNPLLDSLLEREPAPKDSSETIAVLPGSRDGELKQHLPVIAQTLELFSKSISKPIKALVPIPAGVDESRVRSELKDSNQVTYEFGSNTSEDYLRRASFGLIKSGTSTLEASILKCTPVIFYKMNPISEWIFRVLIKGFHGYLGPVGLPNILLGIERRENSVFPELLGPEATPERLASELTRLYRNGADSSEFMKTHEQVRALFKCSQGNSSDRSAARLLEWWESPPISGPPSVWGTSLVSFFWSLINGLRRKWNHFFSIKTPQTHAPSILVGNLQAGGAGKTPVVIALAEEAIRLGKKVVVISRGYGRSDEDPWGDEPREIKNKVPEVEIIVDSNRPRAIAKADSLKPDLVLFDDGFQNLKFSASKTILLVTDRARNRIPFRDFDAQIKHADLVLGTKGRAFRAEFKNHPRFYPLQWKWENPTDHPVWLLSAIADPSELISFYQARGLKIKKTIFKPDHSNFERAEIEELFIQAGAQGCWVAVTEKDRVKIPTNHDALYVLRRSIANRDWIEALFADTLKA